MSCRISSMGPRRVAREFLCSGLYLCASAFGGLPPWVTTGSAFAAAPTVISSRSCLRLSCSLQCKLRAIELQTTVVSPSLTANTHCRCSDECGLFLSESDVRSCFKSVRAWQPAAPQPVASGDTTGPASPSYHDSFVKQSCESSTMFTFASALEGYSCRSTQSHIQKQHLGAAV